MRRHDTVSGILLILSIINFALAAPVPVQDKYKACTDVAHIPHGMITVLGKRGDDEIQKLVENFFGTWKPPIESSDAHVSSSSAPPELDHGSTSVVQEANPGVSMEPPSPPSVQGAWGNPLSEDQWSHKGDDGPLYYAPAPSEYGSDHELTGAHAPQPDPNSGQSTGSYLSWNYWFPPPPRPVSPKELGQNPGLSTDSESYFDWNYWVPPLQRPALPKEVGQAHENQVDNVQQPNPGPSTDSNFDWDYWTNLEDPPPAPRPSPPNELGHARENQVENAQQPKPGPSTDSNFDWDYWTNLEDPPPPRPPPRPALPKQSDQAHVNQVENVQQPKPGPSTDSNFDWDYWTNLEDPPPQRPPPRPALPKLSDQVHGNQVGNAQQPKPGPLTDPDFDWDYWMKLEEPSSSNPRPLTQLDVGRNLMAAQTPPYPRPPTVSDGDYNVNPPSPHAPSESSTQYYSDPGSPKETDNEVMAPPSPDSQAAIQAAIRYAAKGKAKAVRRIPGTARDVGKWGCGPEGVAGCERSLDRGV